MAFHYTGLLVARLPPISFLTFYIGHRVQENAKSNAIVVHYVNTNCRYGNASWRNAAASVSLLYNCL